MSRVYRWSGSVSKSVLMRVFARRSRQLRLDCLLLLYFHQTIDGAPQMRNDDRASHDKSDIHGLHDLFTTNAFLVAARDMICDAIVTTKHERGDQAEHLLGPGIECPRLIGPMIQ